MHTTGKEAFLELLYRHGVRHIFGNPGTTELPLMDALALRGDIRYLLALHEVPAMAMADGYAQASGAVGVVNVHVSGGLGNAMGMLFNAWKARSPLLLTAGQQDGRLAFREPVLWSDLARVAGPYVKWTYEVPRVEDLPQAVRRALKVALTPPTGPVFLALPMDVMEASGDLDLSPPPPIFSRQRGAREGLEEAARVLAAADRPLIVAGDGVAQSDALAGVAVIADLLGAPVYADTVSGYSRPVIAWDHPLYRGPLPLMAPDIRKLFEAADVVLAVGISLFNQYLYFPEEPFPAGTPLVHIEADPWEVGKNYPAQVGVVADPRAALAELADLVRGRWGARDVERAAERRQIQMSEAARARAEWERRAEQHVQASPLEPVAVLKAVCDVLPEDAVVVDEGVTSSFPIHWFQRRRDPKAYFGHRGWALGWGLGATLGVKLGLPDRPVVGLLGEGSAMYGIQGLWTAARERLPVTYLVFNNASYLILKAVLAGTRAPAAAQGKFLGMDLVQPEIDFVALARSLGVEARRVDRLDDLREELGRALRAAGPVLLDVPVERSVRNIF